MTIFTDFSKTFDKVPHFELMKKVPDNGVQDFLLEIMVKHFDERKQFVRVINVSSKRLDITSDVTQGSLSTVLHFRE